EEVVGDARDDRERRRQEPPVRAEDVQVSEEPDNRPLVGQDVQPGERPHEIRDEERGDDEEEKEIAPRPSPERDPVDERIREQEARDSRDPRIDERPYE